MKTICFLILSLALLNGTQAATFTKIEIDEDKTLVVPDDATVSGINTGDQTITLTGDVTGTGTGSFAASLANNSVTDTKLRQSGALSVIGRSANSTGNVADIAASADGNVLRRSGTTLGFGSIPNTSVTGLGTLSTQSGTFSGTSSGTNTGDQTITLTGDVTGTGTGSFATTVATNAISNSAIRQSGALSVIGRSANSTGNVADITASTDGDVLRRSGTTLGFGTIPAGSVTGLGTMATQNSTSVSITGGSVTGITDLAIADGGTGSSTVAAAQSALELPIYSYLNGFYIGYSDSNTVTISPGQGYCNGKYFARTSSANYDLTSLSSGADFHYIYVSNSSSFPTPTFVDSTTEPAYSGTLMGWYNGNDRCIGAVYNQGSSTIAQFTNSGTVLMLSNAIQVVSSANPTGNWTATTTDVDTVTPVNADVVLMGGWNTEVDNDSCRVGIRLVANNNMARTNFAYNEVSVYYNFPVNGDRSMEFIGFNNDDNSLNIWVDGWDVSR